MQVSGVATLIHVDVLPFDEQAIRGLPAGTRFRDRHTGEEVTLVEHTDCDDGWWLSDGSWIRWHHVPGYLVSAVP
jgi:hypothetical protein